VLEVARRRPSAVVIVAPPFVAPLAVLPVARMLGAPVAVDIHTGALIDRRWRWSVPILAWAARHAAVAVVTLASLAERLSGRGAATLVLPDPLPPMHPSKPAGDRVPDAEPLVVAVCGWGTDEPLEELARSAQGRPWQLVLTGRGRRPLDLPPNARLTGFLEQQEYVDLMASADAVVVLTTRDETLLSGAWESLALGQPLIVSGTPSLRSTFGEGARYVENEAEDIASGIAAVLADRDGARARATAQATVLHERNERALEQLRERLLGSDRPGAGARPR
jgi:glycosyltransferase involved in cell wall biosynthesis